MAHVKGHINVPAREMKESETKNSFFESFKQKLPKFVKNYMNFEMLAKKAVKDFTKDVKRKKFPNKKFTYN